MELGVQEEKLAWTPRVQMTLSKDKAILLVLNETEIMGRNVLCVKAFVSQGF